MHNQPPDSLGQIASDMRAHGGICFADGLNEYADRIEAIAASVMAKTESIQNLTAASLVCNTRILQTMGTVKDALVAADRLIREALPKFNYGASALDANAIQLLNETPAKVSAALEVL